VTKLNLTKAHREKYAEFITSIEHAKKNDIKHIVVAAPWVLGDNYDELTTNMNLLSEAKLFIVIGDSDILNSDGKSMGTKFERQSSDKVYELRFEYYGTGPGDTEGEFSILCRAPNKEQAMAIAKECLEKATVPPGQFLGDIPGLCVELTWIFEINDVCQPVIIGHTEHEGSLSLLSAIGCGDNDDDDACEKAGITLHYWEDSSFEIKEGPLAGSTSSLFWSRPDQAGSKTIKKKRLGSVPTTLHRRSKSSMIPVHQNGSLWPSFTTKDKSGKKR
jgi:hypothetical protein